MKCPNCGTENLPGLRFCEQCASPLAVAAPAPVPILQAVQVCPSCRAENRPGLRFCEQCASPLAVPPVPEAPPEAALTMQVCSSCGAANLTGLRFCEQCASPLAAGAPSIPETAPALADAPQPMQVCPSCGAENLPGLRFCEQCASPLAAAAQAMPAVPAGPRVAPKPTAPHPRIVLGRRPLRRFWWRMAAAALVFMLILLFVPPTVSYVRQHIAQRPRVTQEEARLIADESIAEHYPQFAGATQPMQATEFGPDAGYAASTSLPTLTMSADGPVEFDRSLIVRMNAVTKEFIIAETQ